MHNSCLYIDGSGSLDRRRGFEKRVRKKSSNLSFTTARLSLSKVRQLFYNMKDPVFGSSIGPTYSTSNLTKVLQDIFKDMKMSDRTYPR